MCLNTLSFLMSRYVEGQAALMIWLFKPGSKLVRCSNRSDKEYYLKSRSHIWTVTQCISAWLPASTSLTLCYSLISGFTSKQVKSLELISSGEFAFWICWFNRVNTKRNSQDANHRQVSKKGWVSFAKSSRLQAVIDYQGFCKYYNWHFNLWLYVVIQIFLSH